MSVLEKKRSLSDMEFYKNALRLNQAVAEWLMRDFGTRRNPRSVKIESQYISWRNNLIKYDCKRTIYNTDKFYEQLFVKGVA